jgi:spermidine/putrescine transport system substrate-binding protein
MVDSSKIDPATVTSWADLWKPEFKGKLLLQDDLREVFGMALLLKGYPINETEEAHIKDAYELVVKLVPNVRLFNSDNPKLPFLNEEVSIGMIWNGEAYQAAEENDKLTFIWPKEGGIFWTDCLCIPKNAANTDNAHLFINFLMKPEVALAIAEEIGYATPNKAALAMMPESVKSNPTAYPPADVIRRSEFQNDIGEAVVIYEKYWEMLKIGE